MERISQVKENISRRENFAFETTLSGRSHLRLINRLQRGGKAAMIGEDAPKVPENRVS